MDRCGTCGARLWTGGCTNSDCPSRVTVIHTVTVFPADIVSIYPTITIDPVAGANRQLERAFIRASGDCICKDCKKKYRQHPQDMEELSYDGYPYLRILCDGTRVKL